MCDKCDNECKNLSTYIFYAYIFFYVYIFKYLSAFSRHPLIIIYKNAFSTHSNRVGSSCSARSAGMYQSDEAALTTDALLLRFVDVRDVPSFKPSSSSTSIWQRAFNIFDLFTGVSESFPACCLRDFFLLDDFDLKFRRPGNTREALPFLTRTGGVWEFGGGWETVMNCWSGLQSRFIDLWCGDWKRNIRLFVTLLYKTLLESWNLQYICTLYIIQLCLGKKSIISFKTIVPSLSKHILNSPTFI